MLTAYRCLCHSAQDPAHTLTLYNVVEPLEVWQELEVKDVFEPGMFEPVGMIVSRHIISINYREGRELLGQATLKFYWPWTSLKTFSVYHWASEYDNHLSSRKTFCPGQPDYIFSMSRITLTSNRTHLSILV